MKKILTLVCIFIVLFTTTSFTFQDIMRLEIEEKPFTMVLELNKFNSSTDSKDKLCNDIIVLFLSPYTQKAVSDYYSKYIKNIPSADPNFDDVIKVERVTGETGDIRHEYLITIKTMPYLGAQNSVGLNHITFKVNALGDFSLEKFDHIESYDIPPWLR